MNASGHFKIKIYNKAVEEDPDAGICPWPLNVSRGMCKSRWKVFICIVPDQHKIKQMRETVFLKDPEKLQFVPNQ